MTDTPDVALDPPRPDPVRAALEERSRRLTRDVRDYERQLQRLHEQQDSTTRDLLELQAQLTDTTTALAALDARDAAAQPLESWPEVADALNAAPGGIVVRQAGDERRVAVLPRDAGGPEPWGPAHTRAAVEDCNVSLPVRVVATW